MVDESRRLTGRELPEGKVVREAYIALHIRVAKALDADFDVESSKNAANSDWAEDITAFSGDDAASVWLEEVKTKFIEVAGKVVLELGMAQLFAKYDEDGSGELDLGELSAAVRNDLVSEMLRKRFSLSDRNAFRIICPEKYENF